jgi:crossover junction endodeoxyribonuclease RuvC
MVARLLIIGIDCGAEGAIAFMTAEAELLHIDDMPIDKVQDGKFLRSRVSPARLLQLLKGSEGAQAFIERPEAFPIIARNKATGERVSRQPSAKNMLSFGESFGITLALCVATGMAVTERKPREWKKAMSLPANKAECRRLAALKFPKFADMFARVRDDGRSESAFLALYGQRHMFSRR